MAARAGARWSPTRNSCSSTRPPSISAAIPRRWPPRRCAATAPRSSTRRPALHARHPSGRRTRAARRRRPRHLRGGEGRARRLPRLHEGRSAGISPRCFRRSTAPAWPPASIRPRSRYPWCRPPTTSWAASGPTPTAARRCRALGLRRGRPRPAPTAPTGWRRTPCWRRSSSPPASPPTSRALLPAPKLDNWGDPVDEVRRHGHAGGQPRTEAPAQDHVGDVPASCATAPGSSRRVREIAEPRPHEQAHPLPQHAAAGKLIAVCALRRGGKPRRSFPHRLSRAADGWRRRTSWIFRGRGCHARSRRRGYRLTMMEHEPPSAPTFRP